jgi:TonB-like protein
MMRNSLAALGLAAAFAWTPALADPPPAAPRPAPTASTAVAAPDPAAAVLAFYPPAAKAAGVEGQAVISCGHNAHLALKGCTIVSETPPGQGFGEAALAMAAKSPDNPKLNLEDEAAKPPQQLTVAFYLHPPSISPDITRMGHTLTTPSIITKPTLAQIQAAYPERALSNQIEGGAIIDCVVMEDGTLARCTVVGEYPTGFGFGQAALDLAVDFVMRPRMLDGVAVGGGPARLGVRFSSNDPTAPLSIQTKKPDAPAAPAP